LREENKFPWEMGGVGWGKKRGTSPWKSSRGTKQTESLIPTEQRGGTGWGVRTGNNWELPKSTEKGSKLERESLFNFQVKIAGQKGVTPPFGAKGGSESVGLVLGGVEKRKYRTQNKKTYY